MNAENHKLRDMLSQVNNNYHALQLHFVALMQQQNHGAQANQQHDQVCDLLLIDALNGLFV